MKRVTVDVTREPIMKVELSGDKERDLLALTKVTDFFLLPPTWAEALKEDHEPEIYHAGLGGVFSHAKVGNTVTIYAEFLNTASEEDF